MEYSISNQAWLMDWTHRLRLKHLEVLVSLAETQNVSRTADRLNMTQPAVSKWLKELEADIGLLLFERHARGLRVTAEGRQLLDYAVRIGVDLSRARQQMASLKAGSAGRIVIGGAGSAIASVVPQAVATLLESIPQAEVQIIEAPMRSLLRTLGRRELDFAVGYFTSPLEDPDIQSEILYREQMYFAVRPGHPLAGKRAIAWSELGAYRWLIWSRDIPAREVLDAGLVAAGHTPPVGSVVSNSLLATVALVSRTDMVVAMSKRVLHLLEQKQLLIQLPLMFEASGDVAVYWRKGATGERCERVMLHALRAASGA